MKCWWLFRKLVTAIAAMCVSTMSHMVGTVNGKREKYPLFFNKETRSDITQILPSARTEERYIAISLSVSEKQVIVGLEIPNFLVQSSSAQGV